MIKKLLIATSNKGKIKELKKLLLPYDIELLSAMDFDLIPPEETGETFQDNAVLKAKFYNEQTGIAALADDSGLAIDELGGEPGVFSARWAGESGDFNMAMQTIKQQLASRGKETSRAKFVCALALCIENGQISNFAGELEGLVSFPPRGENGFGYDPIFIADGYDITLAEMKAEEKNRISHRAKAFKQLIVSLF
jgi:XTP/dITP diphosphohydrolase